MRTTTNQWSRPVIGLVLMSALFVGDAALAEDRMKTVVLGLKARRGVDPALGEAMSDIVQGEYAADRNRMVFGRADVRRLMEFEAEKQLMGCDTDSCLSEIASALDVDRIINGSLDKIGSAYFIVINELESDGVAPIARVQRRIPLDEDKLFKAVAEMSRNLLKKSARAKKIKPKKVAKKAPSDAYDDDKGQKSPPTDAEDEYVRPQIDRGLVVTSATPATVKIGEDSYGETPVAIEDLPAGDYVVEMQTADGEPLMLDVTVFKDGVTTVETEFDQDLNPSPEEVIAYEDAKTGHSILAYSKIGGGAAVTLLLAPCLGFSAFAALSNGPIDIAGYTMVGTCAAVSVAGCGLSGWGLSDFFFPPEEPVGKGVGTEVLISPPSGQGKRQHLAIPKPMAH